MNEALDIIGWIRQLSATEAVALARALLNAEASICNLPLSSVSMSGRVNVGDEGVDGRSEFPVESSPLLPSGDCVWQVKSGMSPPSATDEFKTAHAELRTAISAGSDYVLFWTFDPVDPTLTTTRTSVRAQVESLREEANCHFLFAEQIERLCLRHWGVLANLSRLPMSGLMPLPQWNELEKGGFKGWSHRFGE
jgi:hypothetical protein